ncbi:MAG: hypothetical protein ACJ74D_04405 [Gaiellaceae bacterium]
MHLFRRRDETLNDRLLREAGYGPDGTKPANTPPLSPTIEPALHAAATVPERLGDWDAVTIVAAPDLREGGYDFATVPDGTLIVAETCDEDLTALAAAIEAQVEPPYRARAVRQDDGQWLVSARRMQVMQLESGADELELSSLEGRRMFSVDGRPVPPSMAPPELALLGERLGPDFAVRASRIDGDLWEIGADPL